MTERRNFPHDMGGDQSDAVIPDQMDIKVFKENGMHVH